VTKLFSRRAHASLAPYAEITFAPSYRPFAMAKQMNKEIKSAEYPTRKITNAAIVCNATLDVQIETINDLFREGLRATITRLAAFNTGVCPVLHTFPFWCRFLVVCGACVESNETAAAGLSGGTRYLPSSAKEKS
jgi:hypothetical protein